MQQLIRVLFVTAMACAPLVPAKSLPQAQSAGSCEVHAGTPRRLELADGRIASVDVKSVAASGGSIMALGRYVYTFPANATPTTSPLPNDSLIGVLVDATGLTSLVPSPMQDRSVVFARAAAGSANSFHVLFVTGIDSVDNGPVPEDIATIWYARFVNGRWTVPRRVVETRGATLNPEFTSELLARGDSLAMVFPFIDTRSRETGGGLIALRRRNGRWSSDTLRTYWRPPAVRARYGPQDTLVVLFSQSESGGKAAEEVYLSRVGTEWTAPVRIGGNGIRPISELSLVTVPGGMIASWSTWQWGNAESNVLEWARVASSGEARPTVVLASGSLTYPFEMVAVGRHPLWLFQGEPYGSTMSFAMAPDDYRVTTGRLTIPFHNARARAVAIATEQLRVFTMKRGFAGTEPMMASWMTDVRIRCPRSERR